MYMYYMYNIKYPVHIKMYLPIVLGGECYRGESAKSSAQNTGSDETKTNEEESLCEGVEIDRS